MPLQVVKSVFSTLFPNYCLGCGTVLNHFEQYVCVDCSNELKETGFHTTAQNALTQHFFGKIPLSCATSLLYFHKKGVAQQLIHYLKYHGQEQIGKWLGEWLGSKLKQSAHFQHIDTIVPVPIHPKKMKKRGYNQVTLFAEEIAKSLNANLIEDVLVKTHSNSAQAQKHWLERQKDNKNLFCLQHPEKIIGKNILLVDDVITTGSTIEACVNELLRVRVSSVGIASMAYVLDY